MSQALGVPGDRRTRLVEPRVTIDDIAAPRAAGPDFIEVPVTLRNHASASEPVDLTVRIVWNDQRWPCPSYSFPPRVAARASAVVPVFLPFPASALPIARQLGIWLQIDATCRDQGVDQRERAL